MNKKRCKSIAHHNEEEFFSRTSEYEYSSYTMFEWLEYGCDRFLTKSIMNYDWLNNTNFYVYPVGDGDICGVYFYE